MAILLCVRVKTDGKNYNKKLSDIPCVFLVATASCRLFIQIPLDEALFPASIRLISIDVLACVR